MHPLPLEPPLHPCIPPLRVVPAHQQASLRYAAVSNALLSAVPGGGWEGESLIITRLQTDSVTWKEMFLGTWIRECDKGPSSPFKIQSHNRRLKRHLMNGTLVVIYSGARGFLGAETSPVSAGALAHVSFRRQCHGVLGPLQLREELCWGLG